MSNDAIKKIEEGFYKKRPDIKVGDLVRVHIKISEKGKERIQVFEGIVIATKGSGVSKTFTVRKISYGVGVEKIFPLHSPTIDKIEIIKRGKVRRSKLYYMRKKVGKQAMKIVSAQDVYMVDEEDVAGSEDRAESKEKEDSAKDVAEENSKVGEKEAPKSEAKKETEKESEAEK